MLIGIFVDGNKNLSAPKWSDVTFRSIHWKAYNYFFYRINIFNCRIRELSNKIKMY